ncbi:unnamed protein product [Anisakis simplex]|uniref:TIL domain-containing protein n=1 Tax=Anisakis simplex TaxID=6269 RepID=A0A0M3K6H8_ANISI|nr:unnamed protein product [Anisakis simplex]
MVYAGHNRFLINQTLNITMQQHRACSCRDCALEGPLPECDGGQVIGPSCTCECSNQMQKTDCKGVNKYWNEDTCTCGCQITHCPRGTIINRSKCACDGLMRRPHDGVNFRLDVSKLPRLRTYVRARPGA